MLLAQPFPWKLQVFAQQDQTALLDSKTKELLVATGFATRKLTSGPSPPRVLETPGCQTTRHSNSIRSPTNEKIPQTRWMARESPQGSSGMFGVTTAARSPRAARTAFDEWCYTHNQGTVATTAKWSRDDINRWRGDNKTQTAAAWTNSQQWAETMAFATPPGRQNGSSRAGTNRNHNASTRSGANGNHDASGRPNWQ